MSVNCQAQQGLWQAERLQVAVEQEVEYMLYETIVHITSDLSEPDVDT